MPPSVAPLDLTPMLAPERATFLALLQGLSPDDWKRPTECPAWDVKGVALHVLGDDLSLLTRQRDASIDSLTLFAVDHPGMGFRALLDGFNEQWVTASHFLSNELVIELLRLVGDWSEAFYREVGVDVIAREVVGFFAETEPSPYWQVIAREFVERFVHQSQIRRAVGAPDVGAEVVTPAAEVTVHVLAAWMRDYAPATGAAIAIDFGAFGAWTWEREAERWAVRDAGAGPGAAATITVAPARAVAAISRGCAPDEARSILTVDGDEVLARGAIDVIAPILGVHAA